MKKLTYILFFVSAVVFSQVKKQPKVGLVLSGGGAKGFAHIGVLKEIEKAGIQIDYIGGTSMGAIIGGLYASGYTAEQIEERIKNTDFEALIQDKIPRKDMPLFHKIHQEKYAVSLPITKNGISLPQGFSKGQNVHNYFTELFSVVDNVYSFKKLPIPFFCVATDIENGEKIVLEEGSLARAVRASGAFPTLLHPVKIGDRLLVDGGVVDNFPVKELRKKGMDIIIGVDVQEGLYNRKQLNSALDLLNQITSFQIHKESEKQKKDVDVYLKPDVKGYNVVSFDYAETIINNGEKEAKRFRNQLDSIAKLQVQKKPVKHHNLKTNKKFLLDEVDIYGNKNYGYNYILGTLGLNLCDSINYNKISKKVNRLTATNNFSNIDYVLKNTPEGKRLKLFVDESEEKMFLKLGLHYDELYGLGILANFTHKHILTDNDILSLDFVLGDNPRYDFNYFINNGFHLGVGLQSSLKEFSENVGYFGDKFDVNKINVRFLEFVNRFYLQTKFNKKYALNLGIEWRAVKANSETVLFNKKPITYERTNYLLAFAKIQIDNFNKKVYPTKGFYFNSQFSWIFYSDRNDKKESFINKDLYKPFTQLYGVFSSANTLFNRITLQHTFEAGFSMMNSPTDAFSYKLGGYNKNMPENFISFYGWDIANYMKNNFVKAQGELRYNFYKKHHLLVNANLIKMGEKNFLKDNLLENIYQGYAIGYGLETLVGPIELRYTWSPESEEGMVLFNLGFWF